MQVQRITEILPTEALVGAVTVASAYYFRGIPAAVPAAVCAVVGYGLYRFASATSPINQRRTIIEKNLKTEFFKRLPIPLKTEILNQQSPISPAEISEWGDPELRWNDLERLRRTAITACLEEKISKKELTYVMLACMIKEMQNTFPGIDAYSTYGHHTSAPRAIANFCSALKISQTVLGNPTSIEDAFFVIKINTPFDSKKEYHHTALLAQQLYPFSFNKKTTLYIFPPHIFEKLLTTLYKEPEKPLPAIGTRQIERFSDSTRRILSITGGTTIPTPNIEANESLSLPFYLHDCYHLNIDSAMGSDRIFFNAFGTYLLKHSKTLQDTDEQKAFQALGQFCLDKEFESYTHIQEKSDAFVAPLIGLYETAGKEQVDDQEEPFQNIVDDLFTKKIQTAYLDHLKLFLETHTPMPNVRPDLSKQGLLNSLNELNPLFNDYKPFLDRLKKHL